MLKHKQFLIQNFKVLSLLWKSSFISTTFLMISQITQGLLPVIQVWAFSGLVDTLMDQLTNHNGVSHENTLNLLLPLAPWLLLIASLLIIGNMISALSPFMMEYLTVKGQETIDFKLLRISTEVPLSTMDKPDFHDLTNRALDSGTKGLAAYFNHILGFCSNMLTILSLLLFLWVTSWQLPIIMILFLLPYLYFRIKESKQMHALLNRQTEEHRKGDYIEELLTERSSAKEIRLFSLKDYLFEKWRAIKINADNDVLTKQRGQFFQKSIWEFLANVVFAICQAGIIIAFGIGRTSAGLTTSLFISIQQLQSATGNIAQSIVGFGGAFQPVEGVMLLLDQEKEIMVGKKQTIPFPKTLTKGISFENVNFIYPGQTDATLHSINFHINPDDTIALVGENGSGKTTLAKLLLGLYKPTDGQIPFDSIPNIDINKEDYYQNISCVFQDFGNYELTLRENVGFGRLDAMNNEDLIKKALLDAGAHNFVDRLPNGLETMLGKKFEHSQELSGGQWQKIAVARALLRDPQLVVLDEPTSSLDPKAEVEILSKFTQLAKEKTTVLISHRIGCARLADRIVVLDKGVIVEQGTHEELIETNGKYAQLYGVQAQLYA